MNEELNTNKQDTTTKYPGDKPIDEKKHLWESFNYWYETMLDRVIQYQQGLYAFRINPTKTIPTQSGQLSIYNILERRKPAVDEAIQYVKVIRKMLTDMGEEVPFPQSEGLEKFLITDLPDPNTIEIPIDFDEKQDKKENKDQDQEQAEQDQEEGSGQDQEKEKNEEGDQPEEDK